MSMRLFLAFGFLVLATAASPTADAKAPAELLPELGKAYASDAKVAFGGVTLGATSAVTAASVTADRARVIAALQVGYAPDGKSTFRAFPWSEIQDILEVKTGSTSKPTDAAATRIVVGARIIPTTWTFGGTPIAGFAVFDAQGRLAFETLLFLPVIRAPIFETPHL